MGRPWVQDYFEPVSSGTGVCDILNGLLLISRFMLLGVAREFLASLFGHFKVF